MAEGATVMVVRIKCDTILEQVSSSEAERGELAANSDMQAISYERSLCANDTHKILMKYGSLYVLWGFPRDFPFIEARHVLYMKCHGFVDYLLHHSKLKISQIPLRKSLSRASACNEASMQE